MGGRKSRLRFLRKHRTGCNNVICATEGLGSGSCGARRALNQCIHCETALAVALLASFTATAVFSPPFSVYLTVTLEPSLRPSYVSMVPASMPLPVSLAPFTVVFSVHL